MSRRAGALGRWPWDNEHGAALVLALAFLVALSVLALALLTISALEPQISGNHAAMLRARYLAEAGIERAFDTLARTAGSWDVHLAGATCVAGAVLAQSTLPDVSAAYGTFTVRVRNDCAPGDDRLTGTAPEDASAGAQDTNGRVIVASTGTTGTIAHTVTAVIFYNSPGESSQSVSRGQVTAYSWTDE